MDREALETKLAARVADLRALAARKQTEAAIASTAASLTTSHSGHSPPMATPPAAPSLGAGIASAAKSRSRSRSPPKRRRCATRPTAWSAVALWWPATRLQHMRSKARERLHAWLETHGHTASAHGFEFLETQPALKGK